MSGQVAGWGDPGDRDDRGAPPRITWAADCLGRHYNGALHTHVNATPAAAAVTKDAAGRRGQGFTNPVGFAASLGVVLVAVSLFAAYRTQQLDVGTIMWIALGAGVVGVAAAIGCIPNGANPVWRESVAMLATVVPLLAALPVAAAMRILAPAVGALAVIPLVLTPRADDDPQRAARTPGSRLSPPAVVRLLGRATALSASALAVALVVAREPFLEPNCAAYCGRNPLLIGATPTTVTIIRIIAATFTLAWCVARWEGSDSVAAVRRPVLHPSRLIVFTAALFAVGLSIQVFTGTAEYVLVIIVGQLLLLALIHLMTLSDQLWAARTRRQVRLLSADLASHARLGHVQEWLRRTAKDDSLRAVFPGMSVGDPAAHRTVVRRGGMTIATIEHSPGSARRVARAITPVVIMGINNDRLHALALAQYESLVDSRREIIHTADATRRRLERDLHDGAQQRLLLLGMTLAAHADRADSHDKQICRTGVASAASALRELRKITNGASPPILDQLGLIEAIRALADDAPIPVELIVEQWSSDVLGGDIEHAAYRVVTSTVQHAAQSGARFATVTAAKRNELIITVEHNGSAAIDVSDDEDRIGAVRGTYSATSRPESVLVQIVLPCG